MFKVSCPHCGVRLTAPDELLGKPVNCQNCNVKFILSNRWTNEPLAADTKLYGSQEKASDSPGVNSVSVTVNPTPNMEGVLSTPLQPVETTATANKSSSTRSDVAATPALKPFQPLHSPLPSGPGGSLDRSSAITFSSNNGWDYRATPRLSQTQETYSILALFDFRFKYYLTPLIIRLTWTLVIVLFSIWLLSLSYFCVSALMNRSSSLFPATASSTASSSVERDATDPVPLLSPLLSNLIIFVTLVVASFFVLLWIRMLLETMMMIFGIGSKLREKNTNAKRV